MGKKKQTPEQIICKLREAEIFLAQGQSAPLGQPQVGSDRANLTPPKIHHLGNQYSPKVKKRKSGPEPAFQFGEIILLLTE